MHNNVPAAGPCGPIAVQPCIDTWTRPQHLYVPGQNMATSGSGTVWWVLPSQHVVYSIVTTGDDTGAIAYSWWTRYAT